MIPTSSIPLRVSGDIRTLKITEEMLYSIFIKFGPIFSLRIMKDFNTKKSRGFGFVSYYNVSDGKYFYISKKRKTIY